MKKIKVLECENLCLYGNEIVVKIEFDNKLYRGCLTELLDNQTGKLK